MIGISKKMLMYAPNYHKLRLINCYNKYLEGLHDISICFGRSSYIYKDYKNGPKDDINSFREIVTIPTVVSHFHRILSLRINEYLDKNKYFDKTIQKGGVSGIKNSIFEQIYKLKNVIKHAHKHDKIDKNIEEKGNELCILFLDISSAFNNLDRDRVYKILGSYHVDIKFINYLKMYYDNLHFYANTKDWTTELIKWKKGLVQGCPLSPILFVTALNYIFTYLDKKYKEEMGYKINDECKILFMAFVDDVCILTKDMDSLQDMYNKIKFFFECLGLPLNKDKCAIMKINSKSHSTGFDDIKIVNSYKYLGEYVSSDGTTIESYSKFISMLGKKLYALDKRKKIDNATKLGIFSKCMLPWIQRKMIIMYDISRQDRLKIAGLIQKYLNRWNNTDSVKIFTFMTDMLTSTTDKVIINADFDEIDDVLRDDVDLGNLVANNSVDFSYSSINKEPDVDTV
jgi:hypothetical protein